MAYQDPHTLFSCGSGNAGAFLRGLGNGLFQQQVVALFNGHESRLQVHIVHSGDYRHIRHFRLGQDGLPAVVAVFRRHTEGFVEVLAAGFRRICHTHDLVLFGCLVHKLGILVAPVAGTDDYYADFLHRIILLFTKLRCCIFLGFIL